MTRITKSNRMFRRFIKPLHWGVAGTSATYVAGTVYLEQIEIPNDLYVDAIVVTNVATVAGNLTVGIYGPVALTTDDPSASTLVVQSASTAQSGTSTPQTVTFTETFLPKGKYYLAFEVDDATATYNRNTNTRQAVGVTGTYARGGGYGTLTNPCPTFTDTGSNMPGMLLRVSR
jgi:hypothetical protein